MITESGEIWPRAEDYNAWAVIRKYRARAREYRRRRLALQSTSLLLALLLATIGVSAQTFVGAGVGVSRSDGDHAKTPVDFFAVGQKEFYGGRVRLRGRGGLRTDPQIPALFQEGAVGSQQDGYEWFARTEGDLALIYVGPFRLFVGPGLEYFKHSFPNEPGGEDAHYHSGLNPVVNVGATFDALKGSHRIAARRILQEFKFREFPYVTAYAPGAPLVSLRHKGTLNPAYLDGWGANWEGIFPTSKGFSVYIALDARYLKYKNFPTSTFGDNYYQRDPVFAGGVGVVFGRPYR